MLRSMTGFGRATLQDEDLSQTWEVRSVNGRHLDLKWRLPVAARCQESSWERVVREYAGRGRVDISLDLKILSPDLMGVRLNTLQATAMLDELGRFAKGRGEAFAPDHSRLLNMSFLWEDQGAEPDESVTSRLEQGLREALEDWNRSRAVEAEALKADLDARLAQLAEWRDQIAERAPDIKEERFATLRGRIENVLERYDLEADEGRMLQEIAVLSDKLDVSEELTRLSAHLEQLAAILEQGGEAGKRLDFTLQECFREINTCGNKIQDAGMSRLVVDCKAELEKCREQVQNLE